MSKKNPKPDLSNQGNTEIFSLIVKPNSEKNTVEGLHDGKIKIKIACPPEKGKANKALIDFISRKANIPKKNIRILSGEKSSIKRLAVDNPGKESILKILLNNI